MRFEVLGPVTVRTEDGSPVAVPGAKVRALLADLLVHHGRPVPVDRLVDDLWGDTPPGDPANTLQTKVSLLRRVLDRAEEGARALVAYGPAGYALRVPDEAVDSGRFAALTARARRESDPRARASLLADALRLWRGGAFADVRDAPFARAAIARLEEQRLTALEELAELRLETGEHVLPADELGDAVADHPLRERLRAAHMLALYRAGRQNEALDAYADIRRRLAEELGVDPGARLTALHQAILRQDPDLAPAAPAAATSPVTAVGPAGTDAPVGTGAPDAAGVRPRTNLPAPVSSLVGRREAVARVCALVAAGRLVTLTGPGGVGKTRLALEAAARLADAEAEADADAGADVDAGGGVCPDGVWFVELAGAAAAADATAETVADTVAAVLGVRDDTAAQGFRSAAKAGTSGTADTVLERLAGALATRRLLLVLDNCEHLVEPVAALVGRLLRRAPGVRVLATSREPLAVSGEVVEAVAPLTEAEAVELFAARAAAAAPGFALGSGNAGAVALICRRLDGIPLALELAATRVRALGVHALADRLHDRFRLLSQAHRDAPARQRTLRAAIDWSWEPLSPPERAVLRRLAVFAGGFTLEAAESVCAAVGAPDGGAAEVRAGDVLDLVTRLVDRSLVVPAYDTGTDADAGTDGGTGLRHRLLESVAAYGLERLDEAGETASARRAHALHYADLAERAAPRLHGRDQRHWLRVLDAEAPNLRAALDHAASDGTTGTALRLVNALSWYWYLRGRVGEGLRSLDAALERADARDAGHAGARARRAAFALLAGDGSGAGHSGAGERFDGADARGRWFLAFARCGFADETGDDGLAGLADEFRARGDRWGEAAALGVRATQSLYRGDLAALRRDAERSAVLFAELGDCWGQLQASEQLGMLAEITGDYGTAARLHREGVRDAEELRMWTHVSYRLSGLGRIALLTGDDTRAAELHERARRLAAEHANRPAEQFAEYGLALGERLRGDLDAAEARLLPWLEWDRRLGVDAGTALILAQLGYLAEQRGDAERAEALHLEGLATARRTGDPRAVALAVEGLAGARSVAGRHREAASLLGTAAALRESVHAPLPRAERLDVDRAAARARAALGEDGFAAAFVRGRTLTVDDQLRRLGTGLDRTAAAV
ncbi:MAG TPA: BTAD domain-containing putative transcriptional regulator [Streptomyces sp.]|uniref:AfsR/SARP family transcriptional regulator n=1 Tax=Streptomyces sp. TaxID=1931 RepID=UPI002D4A3E6F|nr:BTAD domain-containing putative transcriptional regulator [Streptomyces sp.]HZG03288.1 BTAD domain-containing putative transcriptional regulator [Streptomyces sp.]